VPDELFAEVTIVRQFLILDNFFFHALLVYKSEKELPGKLLLI